MRYWPLVLAVLAAASAAEAGPSTIIAGSRSMLCDAEQLVCLRGSIRYFSNPRLVELRSRVQHANGPGKLVFRLAGENRDGHVRRTSFEVRIRGNYSEIVNTRLITDHPDVDAWTLESLAFVPGPPPNNNDR